MNNPGRPWKNKLLRDYANHYKQARSRHDAGLKQAKKVGMHVRTGE